jgi:hypothetical protein
MATKTLARKQTSRRAAPTTKKAGAPFVIHGNDLGLGDADFKWVVGFGITVVIADQPVSISNDDVMAVLSGKFKFSLDAPIQFPTLQKCYDGLRETSPFDSMELPEIDWSKSPFDKMKNIQATINVFSIDTEAGTFALAISFIFPDFPPVLGLKFTGANFSVKRIVKPPELR